MHLVHDSSRWHAILAYRLHLAAGPAECNVELSIKGWQTEDTEGGKGEVEQVPGVGGAPEGGWGGSCHHLYALAVALTLAHQNTAKLALSTEVAIVRHRTSNRSPATARDQRVSDAQP